MRQTMKRDVITISDVSDSEIDEIFSLADEFLGGKDSGAHRVSGRRHQADAYLMATLFYEPSTRTRFSFEAAMKRLGGEVVGGADPATTSAAKGESVLDTVRVMESYTDLIVLRHPCEGAARAAAEHVGVPVINGGDGRHEHPTQTLCDLYTLRRELGGETLRDLNVLLIGDLKNGRTVHSLVYGLARFGANVITMAPPGLGLPSEVSRRLEEDYGRKPELGSQIFDNENGGARIGAMYIAPDSQLKTAISRAQLPRANLHFDGEFVEGDGVKISIDVCYVTRRQGERVSRDETVSSEYPVIDAKFLSAKRYKDTRVLHPLPRVGELGYDLDRDQRGVYFKQAAYGVPIRMALISKLLGISPFSTSRPQGPQHDLYRHGEKMQCANDRCITNHAVERRQLTPKFWLVRPTPKFPKISLRCTYCETDFEPPFYGRVGERSLHANAGVPDEMDWWKIVLFANEQEARMAGLEMSASAQS
jgi:aspartate carbamoyltransferase catalytic subunit